MAMKISLAEIRARMPGATSAQWPQGEPYAVGLSHGSMSLGYYAPVGHDPQHPHERDEIYIIDAGSGRLRIGAEVHDCMRGDAFFVAAGIEHRFEDFSADFATWVVFWGPPGGEQG